MDIYVKDHGIFPDDSKVQTAEIQTLIDKCAESGGGTVVFEAGTYRTGTLWLRSNTYLNLPPMCRIKGSDDFADYNAPDAYPQNTPIPPERANGMHLIVALEVENCGIFGGGIIDGNGRHFGYSREPGFERPSQMVHLVESKNIRIQNVELLNSTYWSCHVHGCDGVWLTGLRVKNNRNVNNSDGLDIDASRNVVISDCIIDTQDDCITFRCNTALLGSLKDTTRVLENVTVTNCQLRTDCNAFRIGVGNGPIRNCRVSNIIIRDSSKGVCLEARYIFNDNEKIGTPIENISFTNCLFDCRLPIYIASHCSGLETDPAPRIRNISFSDITIMAEHNIVVQSNENAVIENITFSNVTCDMHGVPKCIDKYGYGEWDYVTSPAAFYTANAGRITMRDVSIHIEEEESPIEYGIINYGSKLRIDGVDADKAGRPTTVCEER